MFPLASENISNQLISCDLTIEVDIMVRVSTSVMFNFVNRNTDLSRSAWEFGFANITVGDVAMTNESKR